MCFFSSTQLYLHPIFFFFLRTFSFSLFGGDLIAHYQSNNMAECDLTSRVTPYLEGQMTLSLLQFLQEKKVKQTMQTNNAPKFICVLHLSFYSYHHYIHNIY